MSIIGLITLAGIVVNNAIVLVDFINQRRRENPDLSVREAVLSACQVRLRPILMTSITTIFGLLPVAIGYGVGAEFQRPWPRRSWAVWYPPPCSPCLSFRLSMKL